MLERLKTTMPDTPIHSPRSAGASASPRAPRAPQDQADGLRRLFSGRRRVVLPLAANPHGAAGARVLDRLAALLASLGRHVLVVDAASTSPLPHELASVDLSACVLNVATRVSYLAARGLPLDYVDTRGSAQAFVQAVQEAAPQADVVLLHADGIDLARLLKGSAVRPMLLAADHPESIKHAYANAKLLARRCELLTFDLLMVASQHSPRLAAIADSLSGCLDTFLGGVLRSTALIDPGAAPDARASEALTRLLSAQLALDEPGHAHAEVSPGATARRMPPPVADAHAGARFASRPAFR
jgi:flagellar biosynthesis protein FlhG